MIGVLLVAKNYAYKARDSEGKIHKGTISAENERAVVNFIREKNYFATEIKEVKEQSSLDDMISKMRGVSAKEIALFCRQLSTMIDAGVPLVNGIAILIEQTYNPVLKKTFRDIYQQVQQGETLSNSMKRHSNLFPPLMLHMIEAGEVGGVLDAVLARLADHLEKEHKMKEKIKSAMTYPLVVITLAIGIVMFILVKVMPTFMTMFENMKTELPMPTKILLSISGFMQSYWWLVLLALIGAIGLASSLYKSSLVYRRRFDYITTKLPVFGILLQKVAIARFSRTLSTVLYGGVPILTALDVVKNVTGNINMIEALAEASKDVRDGFTMSDTLKKSGIFTPMVVQMVGIGEETGQLDTMLNKIADFYESDVDDMVARLSSLMEPIMITILGVLIGGIIISVALPMFDAVTNVGH